MGRTKHQARAASHTRIWSSNEIQLGDAPFTEEDVQVAVSSPTCNINSLERKRATNLVKHDGGQTYTFADSEQLAKRGKSNVQSYSLPTYPFANSELLLYRLLLERGSPPGFMSEEMLSSYVKPWLNDTTKKEMETLMSKLMTRVPSTVNMVQLPNSVLQQHLKASLGATNRAAERNLSLLAVKMSLGVEYNDSLGMLAANVVNYKFMFPRVP